MHLNTDYFFMISIETVQLRWAC